MKTLYRLSIAGFLISAFVINPSLRDALVFGLEILGIGALVVLVIYYLF